MFLLEKFDANAHRIRRWAFLQAGVDRIMTELREGMDMKTFMSLYTAIHNFCTAQRAAGNSASLSHNRGGGKYGC